MKPTTLSRREFLERTSASLAAARVMPRGVAANGYPRTWAESGAGSGPASGPRVFPQPQEMNLSEGYFTLDAQTAILLPANPTAADQHLARFLTEELSDRYDLQLKNRPTGVFPENERSIVAGSIQNPLVKELCARRNLDVSAKSPGPEGYVLVADERSVLIAGSDERGAFYGLQSFRQMVEQGDQGLRVRACRIRDWPDKPFRGMKLYLPGRSNIPFFRRFVRDFMAQYKLNTLMMEMNACMRLDRHPELNAGWVEFARDTNWSRRNYPPGVPHEWEVNSSHQDTCDGGFLEKDEVAGLVHWARLHHIEVVPEIPSFTHAFYLLTRHKELGQAPGEKWPGTYCACNLKSYELLFDVMDEYMDVMKPKLVHAGHDEWFAPYGLGECCKDKDPGEVYGRDLAKIHDYLAKKGSKMAIWGDYLLEGVRGKGLRKRKAPDGFTYYAPGAMTPEQVKRLVPKDILIFNWFWSEEDKGEVQEALLDSFGFRQVYGNMEPDIHNYGERSKRATILGGAPSSWAATTEFNMGKDLLYSVLGCSGMLWSKQVMAQAELSALTQALMPETRRRLSGVTPPSETGDAVVPLDISAYFNMPQREPRFEIDLSGMQRGRVASGARVFELDGADSSEEKAAATVGTEGRDPNPFPPGLTGIKVGVDATSLVFLHACANAATNKEAFRLIWDFDDSADLLGWYEVVYEDGFLEIIPIRYGVNILEWNWGKQPAAGRYCYGADLVPCGPTGPGPITFLAFEWTNPRLGKVIQEIRMKGTTRFQGAVAGFENLFGEVIPSNAVILKALSYVKKRS